MQERDEVSNFKTELKLKAALISIAIKAEKYEVKWSFDYDGTN